MAVPINTLVSDVAVGNREDLSNELSRLEPEQTPFISNIGSAKADATFTEWQIESIDALNTDNAHAEGDDTALEAANIRERVGNRTQITKKSIVISGTQQAVVTAAVADEYDRQKMLKGIAAKRDIEFYMMSKQSSNDEGLDTAGAPVTVTGASGTVPNPRRAGGMQAWITTNVSRGAGGANGGFANGNVQAPVAGTPRAFTETLFKEVLLERFNGTGQASKNLQGYMSGKHKQEFSAFAGLSETRDRVAGRNKRVVYGSSDVYVGDFGTITAVPHAYGITDAVAVIDPTKWKVSTLRKMTTTPLAVTGDNMKSQMICEKTLKSLNEKSSALIADLL